MERDLVLARGRLRLADRDRLRALENPLRLASASSGIMSARASEPIRSKKSARNEMRRCV